VSDPSLPSTEGPSTRALHADRGLAELPDVAPAIRPSTTFRRGPGRTYRRDSQETTERFEAVIAALEGGSAVAYASGMAAAAAALHHVRPRRVALPDDVYHGVRELTTSLQERGEVELVEPDRLEEGDLWWIETPSNPRCLITDLKAVATEASGRGVVTVCDSTFATPIALRPLSFGIDIVMHAATKAIAGHSDVMAGLLVTSTGRADRLRHERALTGAIPGSLDVWLALRGVRTLAIRQERAAATASSLADRLVRHGVPTYYPGLPDHPGHDVAHRQMATMGSMLSVDLGDAAAADRFVAGLHLFTDATSLGGVESLVERRALSDPTIEPGLVRLSVGIEDPDDLLADVDDALRAVDR
jgi:cystathionine gamma-synthase